MPQFKTTQNIFNDFGDEVWNDNNMDSDKHCKFNSVYLY
jgi:hypothetical protein